MTDLGDCLVPNPTTDHTMFVRANGRIVPRRAYLVLPTTFVSFDWQPKTNVLNVPLPASLLPSPTDSSDLTQPLPSSTLSLDHRPQLPHQPTPSPELPESADNRNRKFERLPQKAGRKKILRNLEETLGNGERMAPK
jgi:hypothetical protein